MRRFRLPVDGYVTRRCGRLFELTPFALVGLEKIQALWNFESSELFDERERAALRFALAVGAASNRVDAEHHGGFVLTSTM
jgi:hypothetical protein